MQGAPFYDAGTAEVKGTRKKLVVLARRVVRRLLRPIFFQLDGELRALAQRQDQLDQQLKAALALGWDHVAMARRLAAIEDQLEESRAASGHGRGTATNGHASSGPSVLYPTHDGQRVDGTRHLPTPHSRVS